MMKNIFVLACITLLPFGCAIQDESSNRVEPMPVIAVNVADSVTEGTKVTFETTAQTPNPCWQFNHFDISRDQKEIQVAVYAEYHDQPCIQTTDTLNARGSVTLDAPGLYTFKFWQDDDKAIEAKVLIQ